ncbi:MAG: hypothetical protein KA354_07000 [Phycisphaerae bacterium]|nr:hypothetical protein [Phycisphaerae bacterium]
MTGGAACRLTGVLLMFGVPGAGANPARADEELAIDRDNLVISRSVSIKPGRYRVQDADGNGVLQVKADDVVVDFRGAVLAGMGIEGTDLSKAEGIGLSVSGAKNVTIRNAKVHGFAFNIRAVDSPGLELEGCDVSYAKAQRIAAGGRPIEIWLVLRSLDAWRSYGAGLWLESCRASSVSRCRGTGTQNGLLLVDSAEWNTRWFGWGKPTKLAYDDTAGWARLFASVPLHEQRTRELSTRLWREGFPPGVPHHDFAILATTQVRMPAGRYRLSTLSDDGIRVFLDGKEVISRWNHHGTTPDAAEVDVAEGVHEFIVHYCQEDGASTLDFGWQKLDQP